MSAMKARPFRLADAMILVAATAIGLGLARICGDSLAHATSFLRDRGLRFWIIAGQVYSQPLLLTWTFAVLVIRLRSPRPRFRRLVRRPGFIACLAATLALVLCSIMLALALGSVRLMPSLFWGTRTSEWFLFYMNFAFEPAFAVLGAWLVLGISGRWRSEPEWIDRAGRLLGFGWLLSSALMTIRIALYY